jgi:hypothetical protein
VELRGAGRRVRVAVRANWAQAESGGEGAVQPRSGGGLCRGAWRIEGAKGNMGGWQRGPWLSVSRQSIGSQ